jgi:crotonobetainyl-CoA:carnitine CoA-transferase CaiB-like acyl-CoA transferase
MLNLHRNKRSLTLNLKEPEGLKVFMHLVSTADLVVENFRPDVKARLGISYEALRAVNPRIILASISGFGQTGPYRAKAGFDQIAQGMGGLMWVTGMPGDGPMRAGIAVADSTAGIYAATGILIALAERERSGTGQWVHTSLLQAQIALMDFQAARYLVDGEVPGQAGNDHPHTTPMGVFPTKDGFINIGVGGENQWRAFCGVLNRPDLLANPNYATQPDRLRHRPALRQELELVLRNRTSTEWLKLFDEHSIPAGPIYKVDEVFSDPQVEHLGIAVEMHHQRRGKIDLVGEPMVLSRTPAHIESLLPELGEHTEQILGEAGYTAAEILELRQAKAI